jgi:hypothetical protein
VSALEGKADKASKAGPGKYARALVRKRDTPWGDFLTKCAANRGPVRSVALATIQAAPAVEPQTLGAMSRHGSVKMPRAFSSSAIARTLVMPLLRMSSTMALKSRSHWFAL